jgi:predicted enzyme related to lactoylglutathione lyase
MHAVVHVEIPVTNLKRAKEWYTKLFAWTVQDAGKDYALWNAPGGTSAGGAAGGLYLVKKMPAKSPVRAYIEVEDIDTKLAEIKKSRGKVLVKKTAVPTFGWWAAFKDPQGAELYLWQSMPTR